MGADTVTLVGGCTLSAVEGPRRQVVRHGTANPIYAGAIPAVASKNSLHKPLSVKTLLQGAIFTYLW